MLNLKNSFIFLFIGIFMISFISAFEFDNVKSYDPITREVTIINSFGLGDEIGKAKLNTPLNVKVAMGYQKVAEFDLWAYEDYSDALKQLSFTNMKNKEKINRDYDLKYKTTELVEVNDYEDVLIGNLPNGTAIYEYQQVGTHQEEKEKWIKVTPANLKKNEVLTIGVFTNVKQGDYVDWIPMIYGVEIEEWATWTQNLNVGLVSYYKFDGDVLDALGFNNLTNQGTTNTTGKIIYARNFVKASTQNLKMTTDTNIPYGTTSRTINMWVYSTDVSNYNDLFWYGTETTNQLFHFRQNSNGKLWIQEQGGGSLEANIPLSINTWHMITITFDGTNTRLYQDGVNVGNTTSINFNTGTTYKPYIGSYKDQNEYWSGKIDEVGVWSRALNTNEITIQLYNGDFGISFTTILAPDIEILYPENTTYSDFITQLNYTNSSDALQCWFTKDNGATNSSPVNCGINFTTTSIGGLNTWTIYANDSLGAVGSDTIIFFINKTVETTLITPEQGSNFTNQLVDFNFTSTPVNTNLTNATLSVWNETDGNLLHTNFTILSGINQINTTFKNTLDEGNYEWNVESCGEGVGCYFATSNNSFIVHLTAPTVDVTAPTGFYNRIANIEETLVYNISETGQNLTEHLDQCWYVYNGTNTSLNCTGTSTNFTYAQGQNNITVYVNDTFGLMANDITTWSYLFEKINLTYDTSIYEGTLDVFEVEVILGGGNTISQAIFEYNNTNYTATIDFASGEYLVTSSIVAPTVANDTNFSLGFYLVISGTTYLLNSQTQLVLNTNFKECGAGEDLLLKISLKDEDDKTFLVGDIELDAQLIGKLTGEVVESISLGFTSVSYAEICLTPNSSFNNYYLDAKIRYETTDYAAEFYNIQKADLADYPNDLVLFDLNLNSSTEFLLRYQGQTLTKVEGAIIQLQRYYISEGIYETVEAPLTSISGTAIVHIDLNTNKYKAIVVKEGEVLDIFDDIVFDCENELSGQCTQNLYADVTPYNTIDSGITNDFFYAISDTGDKLVTTFSIPSGSTKPVNIVMIQKDQFGETTSCNQTVTTSSGSLECTYNKTIGDSYLFLEINKDGKMQAQKEYFVPEANGTDWDGLNWLAMFVLLISLSLMAISSPEWIIGNGVITFIIGGSLWLVNGTNIVVGLGLLLWLIVSAIILILDLAKQEDR